jgi:HD-GYP domain-containing protein (c-di-GMP phosphodiesterase class II)/DNA-binding CsgD family transcriptional regulator
MRERADRLAELLAGLSLATDLGVGVPLETSMRACLVATRLGAELGLGGPALRAVYYTAMLRHLGCTAWSHEAAALVGDDHDVIRTFEGVDSARRTEILLRTRHVARGAPLVDRARAVVGLLTRPSASSELASAQCAQAEALAADLDLGDEVRTALSQIYERYDGRGEPMGLRGDAISIAAALARAAHLIEALHRLHGRTAAAAEIERRRGGELAPLVCDVARAEADAIWVALEAPGVMERVLACEPAPWITLTPQRLAKAAVAFARFADLKTPSTLGHSTSVAAVAAAAAARAGWPTDEVERLRLAALLHDLGAVSVSNRVWEEKRPLGAAAWEQVRLHAYWTERVLSRTPVTASLAVIAGAHHERLDASGYHRGLRGDGIARGTRLLAAADAFVAMGEERPHRSAHADGARARLLGEEVQAGRLCRTSVSMILATDSKPPRIELPAGLTAREVDVLRLLARGSSNKEIASELGIAVRTVKHHLEHVYEKIGVANRAGAALFAVRQDLLSPP